MTGIGGRVVRGCVLGLAGLGLALCLSGLGWLDTVENLTWAIRSRVTASPQKATPEVALILLDQNSLDWGGKHLGLIWPWPREIYGAITEFCTRNEALAIGFDVIFSEPSTYGVADDRAFSGALERSGRSALAVVLGQTSGKTPSWPDQLAKKTLALGGRTGEGPAYIRATLPIRDLAQATAMLCNVNLPPDRDGVYRQVPLFSRFGKAVLPSLGLGLFLAAHPATEAVLEETSLSLGKRRIPLDRDGNAVLNYRGPSGVHQAYSAAWILQNELAFRAGQTPSPEAGAAVRGKYVLFGFSAPGLFDIHATPLDSKCPGVEIHATLLDNLLTGDVITRAPGWAGVLAAAVICLGCGGLMAVYTRAVPLFTISLGALVLPFAAGVSASVWEYWFPMGLPLAGAGTTVALGLAANYAVEGRQRRFIKQAFHHYLSPQVIEQILEDPDRLRLGGERRILSIFFSDLEGFTTLSESMAPEDLVAFLNRYLTAMTDIIHQYKGTIDKYEGDAIIAFWNAPLDTPDHAALAVRAAMDCQKALAELQREFRAVTGQAVRMRIGINTGPAVVGNLGSSTRFDYTVIGDAVNLAARLESANKEFHTFTMISETTRHHAGPSLSYRRLGRIRVKGRQAPVAVFEPLENSDRRETEDFERGVALFEKGQFQEAVQIFRNLSAADPPAGVYAALCDHLIADPPETWDGVFELFRK